MKWPELSVRTSLPLQSVPDLLNKNNGAKLYVYSDSPLLGENHKETTGGGSARRSQEPHRREMCCRAKAQEGTGHISSSSQSHNQTDRGFRNYRNGYDNNSHGKTTVQELNLHSWNINSLLTAW